MTAVALDDVAGVLEIYVEAMLARPAQVRPLADLGGRDGSRAGRLDLEGAAGSGRATTDGAAFFLPERIDRLPDGAGNLMVYRMAVLHQLGGVLFGTYRRGPLRFADFFAGFDEPGLARALFARLEGARIDAALARAFRGVGRDLLRLIDDALDSSLSPPSRPAARRRSREAALFDLARALLLEQRRRLSTTAVGVDVPDRPSVRQLSDGRQPTRRSSGDSLPARRLAGRHPVNADGGPWLEEAAELFAAGATVDHTLRAVRALYPELAALRPASSVSEPASAADDVRPRDRGADTDPEADARFLDWSAPAHHGDPAPERVELRREWRELASEVELRADAEPGPIAAGLMERLRADELGVLGLQDGDFAGAAGLPLTDLGGAGAIEAEGGDEESTPVEPDPEELAARLEELSSRLERELAEAGLDREQVHYYDEWDHELDRYRRRWCRLRERAIERPGLASGGAAAASGRFVDETRRLHADLLRRVRKQFELLKPEEFRRMRRLSEGEELDLDRVVETRVDRRAGRPPDGAVYVSRRRQHRDVAAAFLLDMSASTDAEAPLDEPEPASGPEPAPEYVGVFEDVDWPENPQPLPPGRRVIDIEKESLVLMADALETLGDDYAIYGFSGFGRKEVEFFVAKEFDDDFDREAEDRVAAMEPKRSTRMGPAIRHAAARLAARDAKVKVLLILSDGYPQDVDYGGDRTSRVYGIRDTMVALRETERQGISTFCVTVDPAGHDYLREMCPERRYLVIDEIAALPSQLPKVYRGLTT